jgi:hypothetical protein
LYRALKYLITILLILVVALQTFSKWIVLLNYKINEDYIAKNLCENQKNPISCCRGKCYLGKQLAKDENQEQSPTKGGQREQAEVLWFLQNTNQVSFYYPVMLKSNYSLFLVGKTQEFSSSSFRPPQV